MVKTGLMSTLFPSDTKFQHATAQAELATFGSDPNPRVGCVIVDASGRTLGQGHTQRMGQAHAEVMALRAVREAGHDVRGATAYVTLEPCSHHGRTIFLAEPRRLCYHFWHERAPLPRD